MRNLNSLAHYSPIIVSVGFDELNGLLRRYVGRGPEGEKTKFSCIIKWASGNTNEPNALRKLLGLVDVSYLPEGFRNAMLAEATIPPPYQ